MGMGQGLAWALAAVITPGAPLLPTHTIIKVECHLYNFVVNFL